MVLCPHHLGLWPSFAPLVVAAEVSDRLRLATQVLNIEFWNPALLAREAAAVDRFTHDGESEGLDDTPLELLEQLSADD